MELANADDVNDGKNNETNNVATIPVVRSDDVPAAELTKVSASPLMKFLCKLDKNLNLTLTQSMFRTRWHHCYCITVSIADWLRENIKYCSMHDSP